MFYTILFSFGFTYFIYHFIFVRRIRFLSRLLTLERQASNKQRTEFSERMESIWKERDEAREELKRCQAELEQYKSKVEELHNRSVENHPDTQINSGDDGQHGRDVELFGDDRQKLDLGIPHELPHQIVGSTDLLCKSSTEIERKPVVYEDLI